MKTDNKELFERTTVPRAVLTAVIPTIISQIITVVYNMADTFFIGRMNDPNQVAAATLVMPPFVMLTGIANLFGIGGASLVSRSLGAGDRDKARRCASFSIWTSSAVALLYGVLILVLRPGLFPLLGANEYTYGYCTDYVLWTICIGGVPTVLSACLAHLVRSEGYSREAGFGVAMGGLLNMLLDPLFIFTFRMGIVGAAAATMLSNTASALYFILLIVKNRESSVIRFSPKHYSLGGGLPAEIMLVGFPSFMMNMMSIFSNTVLNKMVASYSNQAIAGMGIAKKIDMFAFAIAAGVTQGAMPLIAYNYAAKKRSRMRELMKATFIGGIAVELIGALLLFAGAVPVVRFFIDDAETVAYGQHFLRIICAGCPAVFITMMAISIFQATGEKKKPMILSLLRKGGLDVPFMFLLNALAGSAGIPWAALIAEYLSMAASLALFIPYWQRLSDKDGNA